jgi:lauroyl/myristoyl acyltransferase
MAMFASMGRVPIYPAILWREGWSRHRWILGAPVAPDPGAERGADLARMTREVIGVFDRAIRERPDQYFWYNKRWVLDPLEAAAPEAAPDPRRRRRAKAP